jgi:hypothetical protein
MPIGRLIQVKELLPPEPDATIDFPAGVVTFGFEERDVVSDDIPAVWEAGDGAVFHDGGPTVHVWDAETRAEYLRFDCFRADPHYHYNWPEKLEYLVVPFDMFANGSDMLAWTFSRLRSQLPSLLMNSGGAHLCGRLDPALVAAAVDAMERQATEFPAATVTQAPASESSSGSVRGDRLRKEQA